MLRLILETCSYNCSSTLISKHLMLRLIEATDIKNRGEIKNFKTSYVTVNLYS